MNKLTKLIALSALMLLPAIPVFAASASITLSNGGLGQVAANPTQFGVAVCNKDVVVLTQSVPVVVTVNGQSATISSAASITPGNCAYSYLPYSQFNMQPGQNYSVQVAINGGAATTYNATVPGTPATADVAAQSGNFLTAFWNWFKGLFSHL